MGYNIIGYWYWRTVLVLSCTPRAPKPAEAPFASYSLKINFIVELAGIKIRNIGSAS